MACHWPGNVRELENCIERAVLVCAGDVVQPHHLPPTVQAADGPTAHLGEGLQTALDSLEREMIIEALRASGGNKAAAARALGMTERLMGIRVKKHGLEPRAFRAGR
jgi:Nif-specific regulatory protein